MKKIISILLIFTMFAPFWFTFILYQVEKQIVKKKVKNLMISKIDKEDLVLLKFSVDEINTKLELEHSKEFEFNDKMYDVIASKEVGDSVYYWCWQDDEETELNNRFSATMNNTLQNDKIANKFQTQLSNILSIQYYSSSTSFLHIELFSKQMYNSLFLNFYKSISICPNSPPPNYKSC